MSTQSIPTISLAQSGTHQLSEAILDACTGPGFFYLTDIPIESKTIQSAWRASEQLFLDNSEVGLAAKEESRDRRGNTGYTAVREEKLAASQSDGLVTLSSGDLKESFYVARLSTSNSSNNQVLPPILEQHRDNLNVFFEDCKKVCDIVITAMAEALGLASDFFTLHHHAIDDRLRLIHYPPLPFHADLSKDGTDIRAGSHSDYGTITLLFQRGVSGLQVLAKGTIDDWIDIPPKEGAIVVNVGDALEFWTSAVFRSTQHRVVMPRSKEEAVSRFSM